MTYPVARILSTALALGVVMSTAACGNSDLTVTSDLGEKAIIKESAVTRLPFDSKKARDEASAFMSSAVNRTNECASTSIALTQIDCWKIYGSGYENAQARLQAIDAFNKLGAKIWTVKYRLITVDLNGNKEADSKYSEINCIPKSMKPELVAAAKRFAEVANLPTADVSQTGSVASAIGIAVCERYGK